MSYTVTTAPSYDRSFRKLDFVTQRTVLKWIKKNLEGCEDPRLHGKALTGNFKRFWRYRIGDYRLLADIQDSELVIVAIDIGHRKDIYR